MQSTIIGIRILSGISDLAISVQQTEAFLAFFSRGTGYDNMGVDFTAE